TMVQGRSSRTTRNSDQHQKGSSTHATQPSPTQTDPPSRHSPSGAYEEVRGTPAPPAGRARPHGTPRPDQPVPPHARGEAEAAVQLLPDRASAATGLRGGAETAGVSGDEPPGLAGAAPGQHRLPAGSGPHDSSRATAYFPWSRRGQWRPARPARLPGRRR